MTITSNGLEKLGFTPNIDFVLQDDGNGVYIKEWKSASPQPTEAEIEAAHAEWEAEQAATQYQRDRKAEYPAIEELIVALAEFQEGRPEMWYEVTRKRTEVKAKYPKP
jgi:hypothetical protein